MGVALRLQEQTPQGRKGKGELLCAQKTAGFHPGNSSETSNGAAPIQKADSTPWMGRRQFLCLLPSCKGEGRAGWSSTASIGRTDTAENSTEVPWTGFTSSALSFKTRPKKEEKQNQATQKNPETAARGGKTSLEERFMRQKRGDVPFRIRADTQPSPPPQLPTPTETFTSGGGKLLTKTKAEEKRKLEVAVLA